MLAAAKSVTVTVIVAELDATALTVITPVEVLTEAVQPELDIDKPNVAAVVPLDAKVNGVLPFDNL